MSLVGVIVYQTVASAAPSAQDPEGAGSSGLDAARNLARAIRR